MSTRAKWGASSYLWGLSSRLWGLGLNIGFSYNVKLQDRDGNDIEWMKDVQGLSFSDYRFGGCGTCELTVKRSFGYYSGIQAGYRIQVYINSKTDTSMIHVWTGYISDISPVFDRHDMYNLTCTGYAGQMQTCLIAEFDELVFEEGSLISDIVKTVAQIIAGKTDIIYDESLIDTTTGLELEGNPLNVYCEPANQLIDKLANFALGYGWGVNKDLKFFFSEPATTVRSLWYGQDIRNFTKEESFNDIINRVYVKDGSYYDKYEREEDMEKVLEYTGEDTDLAFGKETTYQGLVRYDFPEYTDKTISRITFKLRTAGASAGEKVADGDMETAGVANWTADALTVSVEKNTDYRTEGTQSLGVTTSLPFLGVYQDIVLSNGQYVLRFKVLVKTGDFKAWVLDDSGEVLQESSILTADTGFKSVEMAFEVSGSPAYIQIYFAPERSWGGLFYLDDVSVRFGSGKVRVFVTAEKDEITGISPRILTRPYERDITVTDETYEEYSIDVCSFLTEDYDNYYLFFSKPDLSDELYYELQVDDSGDGSLSYYNGASYVAVTGSPVITVYRNKSIERYGLREEIISNVGSDMQKYVNSYLAGKTKPLARLQLQLSNQRQLVTEGKLRVMLGGGEALPAQEEDDTTSLKIGYNAAQYSVAQMFEHNHDWQLESLTLPMAEAGSPSGNLWIEIRETGFEKPGYLVGTSDTQTCSTGDITFNFTDLELVAYRKYYFVIKFDFTVDTTDYMTILQSTETGYALQLDEDGDATVTYKDVCYSTAGIEYGEDYYINEKRYSITSNGLQADISAGEDLPDIAKRLALIEHSIKK